LLVREVARERNRTNVKLARLLLRVDEEGFARVLGFASISAYAEAAIDQNPSKTKKLVAVARAMRVMPKLREAADSGELGWTKLYLVACAATSDDDVGEWIEKAKSVSKAKLEELAFGQEMLFHETKVTPEEAAEIERAVQAVWVEQPEISEGAALALICRRYMQGEKDTSAGRARQVVTTCDSCKKSTLETRRGSLEIPEASAERIACDAEILDIRKGPAPVRRAIPPKIANFIDARDKGRCRFPGCTHRAYIDRHHENGWRAGHDPRHVYLLCSQHHTMRHEGHFTVSGDANVELTFKLRDGTKVETRVPRESSRKSATASGVSA